jgi:hypothetical protein
MTPRPVCGRRGWPSSSARPSTRTSSSTSSATASTGTTRATTPATRSRSCTSGSRPSARCASSTPSLWCAGATCRWQKAESRSDDFNEPPGRPRRGAGRALSCPDPAAGARPGPGDVPSAETGACPPREVLRAPPPSCARCPTASSSTRSWAPVRPATSSSPAGRSTGRWREALAIQLAHVRGASESALTGQDTRRRTFSHRHSVLVDYSNGEGTCHWPTSRQACTGSVRTRWSRRARWATSPCVTPLSRSTPPSASSAGTRWRRQEALVAWEAQFGLRSGAQIIIDNFLVAAENKWGQFSGSRPAAAARVRGPGARALVGALNASCPISLGTAASPSLHVRAVLPSAALTGG